MSIQFPIQPEEATKSALKKLPSRRMRDVLEKRFGLKGGKKKTLEAIGKEYKITRERVRQIETDALKQLSKPEHQKEIEPLLVSLEDYFKKHGDVLAEPHLFSMLASVKQVPHVAFLLHVGKPFSFLPETTSFHRRWTTNKNSAEKIGKTLEMVTEELENQVTPVSETELNGHVARAAKTVVGDIPSDSMLSAMRATSKLLKQNPYGEYGLVSWPTINPRGVKDKAYMVLAKAGKPMHFRDVAQHINTISWSRRKAHPQTVHNELIKDPRFVLVGRGLYALSEWGYEPGTVRDVLVSVFKQAGKPLQKDEVIKLVMEKRMVKTPTILLNLQNRSLFKRVEGGKYLLT